MNNVAPLRDQTDDGESPDEAMSLSGVGPMGDFDPDADIDGMDEEEQDGDREQSREEKLRDADLAGLTTECLEAINEIKQLEEKRQEINAKITAVRSRMESKGINRKALAVVLAYSKMTEDQADGFDTSVLVLRKAINQPMQSDLFG